MNGPVNDLFEAGKLIQWALQSQASPTRSDEYSMLLDRYLDRIEFRETVNTIADGLGLYILGDVRRGYSIVLAPKADSVFMMPLREYRSSPRYSEDNRLLDGLIHVAIAATVFPRDTDLLEDSTLLRNPVTVEEIEDTLRQIVVRLEEVNREKPDLVVEEAAGLYEAWRVYKKRPPTKETKDNRAAPWTTRRMIELALEYLCKQRCFKQNGVRYQPLRRYQVLVQEYAASRVYQAIQRVLENNEGAV